MCLFIQVRNYRLTTHITRPIEQLVMTHTLRPPSTLTVEKCK